VNLGEGSFYNIRQDDFKLCRAISSLENYVIFSPGISKEVGAESLYYANQAVSNLYIKSKMLNHSIALFRPPHVEEKVIKKFYLYGFFSAM